MALNQNLFAKMREATRTLMSGGAGAATAAIQKALRGAVHDRNAGASQPPVHERDEKSSPGNASGADGMAPDFVADLLARLGVQTSPSGPATAKNPWEHHTEFHPEKSPAPNTKNPGQFLTKSLTNHAGTRLYKLYIPSGYQGQAMPLMVMLHGCTQNPDDFAEGTRMNAVAEETQCFVVYPAQAQSANSSKCWNWFNAVDQQREQGEPSIIADITREVIRDYQLDADRVYIAGLSAGGAMAIIMGTTYPDLYAAVGVHSGLPYAAAHDLSSAFSAMKGGMYGTHRPHKRSADASAQSLPIIVFHGDADTTVHARNGDLLMAQNVSDLIPGRSVPSNWIKPDVIVQEGQVVDGHRYTRTSHHAEDGQAIAEHWLIHGAGHAWAGGSANGSYTDGKGPDATREMMRFFSTHAQTPVSK